MSREDERRHQREVLHGGAEVDVLDADRGQAAAVDRAGRSPASPIAAAASNSIEDCALAAGRVEELAVAADAADEHRRAEDEQDVAEDRADDRGLDDLLQALAQGEEGDDELRRVAEGDVEKPADARPGLGRQLLGGQPHQRGRRDDPDRGHGEDDARGRARQVDDDRQRDERGEQIWPAIALSSGSAIAEEVNLPRASAKPRRPRRDALAGALARIDLVERPLLQQRGAVVDAGRVVAGLRDAVQVLLGRLRVGGAGRRTADEPLDARDRGTRSEALSPGSAAEPGIAPSWPCRSSIGFAFSGAVIVWSSLTSLSVTSKARLTLPTPCWLAPGIADGSLSIVELQLAQDVVVGAAVDAERRRRRRHRRCEPAAPGSRPG